MTRQRIILHVDMDAFFAAVEQRDHPDLRGKPIIVGGPSQRGVVSTASYEARPFGVHSALPMAQALRRCPQAIVVPVRMRHYAAISRQIMDVMSTFTPLMEPLSIDEAFLDMTGAEALFGAPDAMARSIKDAIVERTQLTCSVGIASNKFLAKLASDLDKPDGITWVPFGQEESFIAPLAIDKLWGVGPKAAAQLKKIGLATIGDVARASLNILEGHLGARHAAHLHALAHAEDDRRVVPSRGRKSVGSENTLAKDVRGRRQVQRVLRRQCERVARHLRRASLRAGGIRVKLRYSRGFRLQTGQCRLPRPVDDSRTLFEIAAGLLDRFDLEQPIRLVGAAAFDLEQVDSPKQLHLFEQAEDDQRSDLEHAVDEIRDRFGDKIDFGSS
ncbi:MAG: DNA polymerase IV [Deltaproteobacteria bacterium]|nr:MAG: DNA polymerase IV [Deltaproteobacteria bacterium]